MPGRLCATDTAARLVRRLRAQHGPLLFHLSGGCCEGSAPMCLRQSGFRIGARDMKLGEVEGCGFYVGAEQFPYWANYHLTLDVLAQGGSDSFSLEAVDGQRFVVRSRLLAATERAALGMAGPPPGEPPACAAPQAGAAAAGVGGSIGA